MPPQKKKDQKASKNDDSPCPEDICPVPLVNCPGKEKHGDGRSVQMYCTNASCVESRKPIHAACFKKLEDDLVKSLTGNGRSRRWTSDQCRQNLWTRRTKFIDKLLCCKCGLGRLFLNKEEAMKFRVSESAPKAKSSKALPKLSYNTTMQDKHSKKKIRALEKNFLSVHSDDEMLPEPNPKGKIVTIKAQKHLKQPSLDVNNNVVSKSPIPAWIREAYQRSSKPEAILERSKELLEEKRNAIKEQSIRSSLSPANSETSLSQKTSIDLGVWTACSSSPVDSSFEMDSPDSVRYHASEQLLNDLKIMLTDLPLGDHVKVLTSD